MCSCMRPVWTFPELELEEVVKLTDVAVGTELMTSESESLALHHRTMLPALGSELWKLVCQTKVYVSPILPVAFVLELFALNCVITTKE